MDIFQKSFLLVIFAGALSACSSFNAVAPDAHFDAEEPTGILLFSTHDDRSETTTGGVTQQIRGRIYVPGANCAGSDDSGPDAFTVGGWGLAPVGPRDRNTDHIVWHTYRLAPGDYVLTEIVRQRGAYPRITMLHYQLTGGSPLFHVEAGRITYAGDYRITANIREYFNYLGHDIEAAEEYMENFANVDAEMVVSEHEIAMLDCVPARGERAGDTLSTGK